MAALYIKLERLLRWHASKATRPLSGHQVSLANLSAWRENAKDVMRSVLEHQERRDESTNLCEGGRNYPRPTQGSVSHAKFPKPLPNSRNSERRNDRSSFE